MKSINNFLLIAFAAASLALAACNGSESTSDVKSESVNKPLAAGEKIIYQCPMHPEVTSNKPGKCPKCGMDLEKAVVKDSVQVTMKDTLK